MSSENKKIVLRYMGKETSPIVSTTIHNPPKQKYWKFFDEYFMKYKRKRNGEDHQLF